MPVSFKWLLTSWLVLLVTGCARTMDGATASAPEVPPIPVKASSASPQVTVLSPQFTIPGLNRQRTVRIYVPPGYASSTKRYPVLYMHDGQNLFDNATAYAGEWGVDETLDDLALTTPRPTPASGVWTKRWTTSLSRKVWS